MSIRTDSYASAAEVQAFTQHLLSGQSAFNDTTQPTLTQVEKFIDRVSAILNLALANAGFDVPVVSEIGKLACDDWVTARATEYVELTRRGVGYSEGEGSRVTSFRNLQKSAKEFVEENRIGFVQLGVTVSSQLSDGLAFTGLDADDERSDPDDTALEQPKFTRHTFDDPTMSDFGEDEDD